MPPRRRSVFPLVLVVVLLLLHGVPWSLLVLAPAWPTAVTLTGTAVALIAVIGFPLAMWQGHGRQHRDALAVVGDSWLGVVWQLFTWSILGWSVNGVLALAGVDDPGRSRWVAAGVLIWVAALSGWGLWQARRIPAVRPVDIVLPRLGRGLDGLRVVLVTDTHFGPLNRAKWSAGVAERVNALDADVVAHAGDIADGSVDQRRAQAAPLATMKAVEAKVYITGNHEYMSGAIEWSHHMADLGFTVLHNAHLVIERGGDRLVVAGVDDRTAAGSGVPGHGADLAKALTGVDPDTAVVLLAHQPKMVAASVAAGVDLQLAGHTHGGQIWPFHLLVRAEQGALHGLSRHGERTQLYTSRGSGFWGPPFRVFAPSEITLITLRSGRSQ